MLSQGLECIGLFIYFESEQERRLAARKVESLLNKMRSHYHESLNGENNIDCSEETKTEEQKD